MERGAAPWLDGPTELLQHAADHLASGRGADLRLAMISVDNAVELMVREYLSLPESARSGPGPTRRELDAMSGSFGRLLGLLESTDPQALQGIVVADIEWYHRLRNQLYHVGNGITADAPHVRAYFGLASTLFMSLFGRPPAVDDSATITTRAGAFLQRWAAFDGDLRRQLPPKDGYAYFWKRDYIASVSGEAAGLWETLVQFRNAMMLSPNDLTAEELSERLSGLDRLRRLLGI